VRFTAFFGADFFAFAGAAFLAAFFVVLAADADACFLVAAHRLR
jgi:hypothetical protein